MSQKADILNHLRLYGTITPLEALNLFGCFRLAPRIAELKEDGLTIKTEKAPAGHAIYRLERPGQGVLFNV